MKRVVLLLATACSSQEAPLPTLSHAGRATLEGEARSSYDKRDWKRCAEQFEQLGELYDAACCHAFAGDRDGAFALLTRAFDAGYDGLEHMKLDPDLEALHSDPRWAETVADLDKRTAERRALGNTELATLFAEDQADRAGPMDARKWEDITPRDARRGKRVDEIVAARGATNASDFYFAAMIHQHGGDADATAKAHAYAMAAVILDPTNRKARWLAAASEDRWLTQQDKRQRWGTQYQARPGGPWRLMPYEEATTDAQRAEWEVPPIAEALERAKRMNERSPPGP